MEDILFSRQQYDAIITRLEGLKLDIELLRRQQQPAPLERLERMDTSEVLQLFQISPRTILRWRKSGAIPYEKVGGRVYYDPKKLFDYATRVCLDRSGSTDCTEEKRAVDCTDRKVKIDCTDQKENTAARIHDDACTVINNKK